MLNQIVVAMVSTIILGIVYQIIRIIYIRKTRDMILSYIRKTHNIIMDYIRNTYDVIKNLLNEILKTIFRE
jgi:hypothetical protein